MDQGQRQGWVKIFAPAGAGKTRHLVDIARSHVEEDGLRLREMAIVSFTRAAAAEIGRRVADGREVSRDDLAWCRTIHSTAFRLLGLKRSQVAKKHLSDFFETLRVPFTAEDESGDDEEEFRTEPGVGQLGNFLLSFVNWQRNLCASVQEGYNLYHVTRPELMEVWSLPYLERFAARYAAWKHENDLYDFTDMVEACLQNGLGPDVPCLIGDEAQDQTTLQWRLFNLWAERAEVVYTAGDDDQGIYGFLGTTPDDFLGWPGVKHYLDTNYRCGAPIVRAAQGVIERNRRREPKEMKTVREAGAVRRLMEMRPVQPGRTVFVLARNRYLLKDTIAEFEEAGIPFACRRGSGGLSRSKKLSAYRAMRALSRGDRITLEQLGLIYLHARTVEFVARGWKKRVEEMARHEEAEAPMLLRLHDLANLGATEKLLGAIEKRDARAVLSGVPSQRIRYWERVMQGYGEAAIDSKPDIEFSTIHGVKGLEADDVYLFSDVAPVVQEEIWHDPEPERRTLYVAMTRAKDNLYLVQPQTRRFYEEIA